MIRRSAILAVMALGVGATALPQHDDRPPWLVWNASASVPIGLYAVARISGVHAGDLVVARPPEPLARFLADGGYLPRGVPLLKHVAALAGQTVCRIGRSVTVDAIEMGEAFRAALGLPESPEWHAQAELAFAARAPAGTHVEPARAERMATLRLFLADRYRTRKMER